MCNLLTSPPRLSKLPLAAGSVKWANRDRQKAEGLGWCELSQTEEGVWKGTPLHRGGGGGVLIEGAGSRGRKSLRAAEVATAPECVSQEETKFQCSAAGCASPSTHITEFWRETAADFTCFSVI